MNKKYRPLTIPNLVWNKALLTQTYGELVAQPLEPGFGITLGNALRRVLLGGIEGAAVTSYICKGINNEFTVIPGFIEDAMQLSLNIKSIIVATKDGRPGTMRLYKKGPGVVTVGDIQADEHLELINKDFVLAHIAQDGECDIQFFVEPGRGYQIAKWPLEKAYQDDGRVYLDALFSPITKVMFDVEKTRVGEAIDFDRLILRVHTNGSINPLDSVHYAVSVLRTQLEHFLHAAEIPFNEISDVHQSTTDQVVDLEMSTAVAHKEAKDIPVDLLLKSIDELELSARAHNCLKNNGIYKLVDLVNLSEDDLLTIKNFGDKSLNEVKHSVKSLGLSFGMNIKRDDLEAMLPKKDDSQ
jgi:DNA-directed RNA polymerase subunit alpha